MSIYQYQSDMFSSGWARLNVVHTHESALLFDVILSYSNPSMYTFISVCKTFKSMLLLQYTRYTGTVKSNTTESCLLL